jgi:hypothetical protein
MPFSRSSRPRRHSPRRTPRRLGARWVVLALVLVPLTAWAGRTVKEPGSVKAVPRMVPAAKRAEALKALGLDSRCTDAVLRSRELPGFGCRLAIFSYLNAKSPLATPADLAKRTSAADEALAAAESIATYEPLKKTPNLEQFRVFAHEQACRTVLEAYDAISAAGRASGPLQVEATKAAGTNDKGLFKQACECAQTTASLAGPAQLSVEERGRLQTVLTKRSCFLDKSKLAVNRGGPESEFSGRAGQVIEANTDEARLLDYAKARDIGLDRCRSKSAPGGRVTDKGGLKQCACGEIKRWRFPKERGRADVEIVVPLVKGVGVRVTVNAPGKVTSCGPLEGPGL